MKKVQITFTTNPKIKRDANSVANKLGMSLSTALNMFLNQMVYRNGLPFNVKLPKIHKNK